MSKLHEVLRDTAFDRHTYKHTTMGFLKDIEDMPNEFGYSRQFFDRYYRPEYTTIIVAGDVEPKAVRAMVAKHWGEWQRGNYKAAVSPEPPQQGQRSEKIDWPTPTLPLLAIAYKTPAYTDTEKDFPTLDLISFLGFSETSDLYQRLVVTEQKVDMLGVSNPDSMDPYLFTVLARVKNAGDIDTVRQAILETANGFKDTLVSAERLDAVKKHLKYSFALSMDNSEAIASTLAGYVALRRTPETINKVYAIYDSITPEDVRAVARKYFVDSGRTIATLTGAPPK
jgi:zinc protease